MGKSGILQYSRVHGDGTTSKDLSQHNTSGRRGSGGIPVSASERGRTINLSDAQKVYNEKWENSMDCFSGPSFDGWERFSLLRISN